MRRLGYLGLVSIWLLLGLSRPLSASVKLLVRDGRPIVDGVFVNGHGPYRFLIDTGSNVDLIECGLARRIGMVATFKVDLASAVGKVSTPGSDDNEVALESARAGGQKFLFSPLQSIRSSSPDVQGVLGEWFLAQFDYTLDLRGGRLEFGRQETAGTRSAFLMVNARPVVSTSLGQLALDSGRDRLVLFGIDSNDQPSYELRTVSGTQRVARTSGRSLTIAGSKVANGDALTLPNRPEPGVDGLMPLSLFKAVYFCNSQGFVVFR